MNLRPRSLLQFSRSHLRDSLIVVALIFSHPSLVFLVCGAVVFLLGLALRLWAKGTLQRGRTLTVTGPYALCRHPFYLGNLLLDSSICLLAGLPWLLLLYVPIFLAVYWPTIRKEESFLKRRFPDLFPLIKDVPRLLPRLPRRRSDLRTQWRFRTLLKERELSRTSRLLAVPLLIFWAGSLRAHGWLESVECEGIALLLGALALHLAGRLIYQALERRKRSFSHSPGWSFAGLCASAACLLLMALFVVVSQRPLPDLAAEYGALPLESSHQLNVAVRTSPSDLYLIDDDVLDGLGHASRKRLHIVRTVWSDFEVYHLVRRTQPHSARRA